MNKSMTKSNFSAVSGLLLMLTACGTENSAEGISPQSRPAAASAVQNTDMPVPSAEELLKLAEAASREVTGYKLHTDREEHVMTAPDGSPDAHYRIVTKLTLNPLAAYRELDLLQEGDEPKQPLKRYVGEEAVYSAYRETGWVKEKREDLPATLENLRGAVDLPQQLQALAEAGGDRSVAVQNGNPLLTVVLEGNEKREIAEQYMRQSDDSLPRMQGNISRWDVHRLEVSYEFDRTSLLPVSSTVKFELAIPEDAELQPGAQRKFNMRADYSDYNKIDRIEIPAEVIQQAGGSEEP
ncbi:DUF6612 family protein [Saccharibacillus deserti]|uniref:DUF6612 family protein n=1 Tax=Saccharibacillus deserti TaxID=1634444 RepID=UPI001556CDA1|nr:DUF6612 family protein [Saccharibacillus deserti]